MNALVDIYDAPHSFIINYCFMVCSWVICIKSRRTRRVLHILWMEECIDVYNFAWVPLRTLSSFVASMMLPLVLSLPVMNAFCPFSLPLERSNKVSSERMIVTSALGFALPLNTVTVFFKSMVHVTVSLASLVTWSSKMPLAFSIWDCLSKSEYFEKVSFKLEISSEA